MTEQGRKLLGAGCGNREGWEGRADGLGGSWAAYSSGPRPLSSKASHALGSLTPENQENLVLKGLIEEREGEGIAQSQGRKLRLSWLRVSKGKSFAKKEGKMDFPSTGWTS